MENPVLGILRWYIGRAELEIGRVATATNQSREIRLVRLGSYTGGSLLLQVSKRNYRVVVLRWFTNGSNPNVLDMILI